MKLYVVRHGETVWNKLHKVQGVADIPLAENGILLAEKTGEALKDVSFDLCITSPLIRARKTAELILEKQSEKVSVIEDARIQEINFGVLEGVVCMNDAREYLDPQMEKFFTDPWNFDRPKDGESIRDVLARTKEFWEELIHNPKLQDKTILIATHGCCMRALLRNVYEDKNDFWHGGVPYNCAVSIIEVQNGVSTLLADNKIYYDPSDCVNFYKEVK